MKKEDHSVMLIIIWFVLMTVLLLAAEVRADTEIGATFAPPGNLHGGSGFSITGINEDGYWARFDLVNQRFAKQYVIGVKPTIAAGKRWEFFDSDKFAVVTEFGAGVTNKTVINSCYFIFHSLIGFAVNENATNPCLLHAVTTWAGGDPGSNNSK